MVEVSTEAIASLAQYYDQPLRCFTFGDFHLSPMVEEFEEILGCPLGGKRPYLFSGFYPSLARISKIVQISTQELDHRKQVENGVVGIPRRCLKVKARILAGRGEWAPFIDILALLIFANQHNQQSLSRSSQSLIDNQFVCTWACNPLFLEDITSLSLQLSSGQYIDYSDIFPKLQLHMQC